MPNSYQISAQITTAAKYHHSYEANSSDFKSFVYKHMYGLVWCVWRENVTNIDSHSIIALVYTVVNSFKGFIWG